MVSCACPPLHLHTSRVDLLLCYNLYLTTVLSSCFFSVLLLFHLVCAGMKGACLTSACISPGRTHFTVSCHLILSLPGRQSLAQALLGRACRAWLSVLLQTPSARLRHTCPRAACAAEPCVVRGQAELGAEAEFVQALLPLQPALGCSCTAEGS